MPCVIVLTQIDSTWYGEQQSVLFLEPDMSLIASAVLTRPLRRPHCEGEALNLNVVASVNA